MSAPGAATGPLPDFDPGELSALERLLRLFSDVRPGEGRIVVLMFLNVVFILCAYYFIKPLREGWLAISGIEGLTKMEVKAYSSFGQALVLVFALGLYARLVPRWPREVLITRVTLFCMSNMVIFWALQPGLFIRALPYSGVVFYLWVGMFGVFVVAQFWAFAADLYADERGNRLLPVIAIGATTGAVTGSFVAQRLVNWELLGSEYLLLAALLPLAGSIYLTRVASASELAPGRSETPRAAAESGPVPGTRSGAVRLVLGSRFLLGVAVVMVLTNWVNTNGENLLFRVVQEVLEEEVISAAVQDKNAVRDFIRNGTTAFYGNFFFWVNLVALLLQSLVASRLLKYGGFGAIYLLLPVIALISYSAMALIPVLWVIKMMKVAENATDYSIANLARHVLWLPLPAAVKYQGKPTVDSLFARLGDGLAACTVLVGVQVIGMTTQSYFVVNVALVLGWLVVAAWVVREHGRIVGGARLPPSPVTADSRV